MNKLMLPRIAFIDDELFYSRYYIDSLGDRFDVVALHDAGEALSFIQSADDLVAIIVDVMMPAPAGVDPKDVNDGLDTGLWLIRQLVPWLQLHPIPVLILTNRQPIGIVESLGNLGLRDGLITVRQKLDTPYWILGLFITKAIQEAQDA
jgi:CheY-like chemotaxis protein